MTQTTKNWIYGIGGATLLAGGYFTYDATTKDHSEQRASAPAAQSVNISTTGEVPLTFQMSTATVDICYFGAPARVNEKDLLDPVYLSGIKSLGFTRSLVFSDGAITNVSHLKERDGKGYNGNPADFPTDKEYREAMSGVLVAAWKSDFLSKTLQFTRAWGVATDVCLNPNDTWKSNRARIDSTKAEYIFFGSEEVSTDVPISWTWQNYVSWASATRDSINKYYTGKKLIADCSLVYKTSKPNLAWRNVNPTNLTGFYGGDAYIQIDPDILSFSANQDSNVIRARVYFDSIFPGQISLFQSLYPGWKMIIGECHIEDNRDENVIWVSEGMVGVYVWSRLYETFLKNQATIPMAVQMSLKRIDNPADNASQIIRRLNPILNPARKVTTVSFTGLEGCTGTATRDGKNHTVLINNWSRNTYTLSEIYKDGAKKTPTFTAVHHSSSSWSSDVRIDSVSGSSFTITPGVTVLNFTLK